MPAAKPVRSPRVPGRIPLLDTSPNDAPPLIAIPPCAWAATGTTLTSRASAIAGERFIVSTSLSRRMTTTRLSIGATPTKVDCAAVPGAGLHCRRLVFDDLTEGLEADASVHAHSGRGRL